MLGTSVLRYPDAHILNAAALELLLGVVIMGWGAEGVCVLDSSTEGERGNVEFNVSFQPLQ